MSLFRTISAVIGRSNQYTVPLSQVIPISRLRLQLLDGKQRFFYID